MLRTTDQMTISLALTWDGARWPMRLLSAEAQAFLGEKSTCPRAVTLSRLLAMDRVREIRLCWVPRLKGGEPVLCLPFATASGMRLHFEAGKWKPFGDVLGIVYRRRK
jgi:hypothetical protein